MDAVERDSSQAGISASSVFLWLLRAPPPCASLQMLCGFGYQAPGLCWCLTSTLVVFQVPFSLAVPGR